MNDDLQNLWQEQPTREEDKMIWTHLIQEKESGFREIVRLGNQMEYLVTLIMTPILALCAWKAKFVAAQAGFALLTVSLAVLAVATYVLHRQWPRSYDRTLREQLEALIDAYDRRVRFLRSGKIWVSVPVCAGAVAVILSPPGASGSAVAWGAVAFVVGVMLFGQRMSFSSEKASILRKRQDAQNLLEELRKR